MFERFTDQARLTVVRAREEARHLGHDAIGPEHLLLGLLVVTSDAQRLVRAVVSLDAVRAHVQASVDRSAGPPGAELPFAPAAEDAVQWASRESRERGHRHVATGHLLLGLLRDERNGACRALVALGADLAILRERAAAVSGEEGPVSGVRSWGGSAPLSERVARARERAQAERDPVHEGGPAGWEFVARAATSTLRALAASRRHAAHRLRGEVATIDLAVGVLAVDDAVLRQALAEAGSHDPSPARLAPGYSENTADDLGAGLSGAARRACSMAVRLGGGDALITPAHLLLATLEALGPVRSARAAERLGADDAALRGALLSRTVAPPDDTARRRGDLLGGALLERFTDRARRVLVLAQAEAHKLDHDAVGTEHLLLGLIDEGQGVAAKSLEALGIGLTDVRKRVEAIIGRGQESASEAPPALTAGSRTILEMSEREAQQMRHNYIGTEHLLLGLLRVGEGVAAQVLRELGADLSAVRTQVARQLTGHPAGSARGLRATEQSQEAGWTLLASGSERTWRALGAARHEASARGHSAVGVRDLVLGALGVGDELVAAALAAAGAGEAPAGGVHAETGEPPPLGLSMEARMACLSALTLSGNGGWVLRPGHLLLACLAHLPPDRATALGERLGVEAAQLTEHLQALVAT